MPMNILLNNEQFVCRNSMDTKIRNEHVFNNTIIYWKQRKCIQLCAVLCDWSLIVYLSYLGVNSR